MAAKKDPQKELSGFLRAHSTVTDVERCPTGSVSMDKVLNGGVPFGKFILCYSAEGIGKSTMAAWIAKFVCVAGKRVLWVDAERALTHELLEGVGLLEYYSEESDPEKQFHVVSVDNMRDLDVLFAHITGEKKFYDFVVVDSWNAVQPSIRKEIPVEDCRPGVKAIQDATFLPKYKTDFGRMGMTCWFIAQKRAGFSRFNSTYGVAISNAMRFFADAILSLDPVQKFNGPDGNPEGSSCRIVAEKIKFGPGFKPKPLHIVFGKGISDLRTLTALMIEGKDLKHELGPTSIQRGSYYVPQFGNPEGKSLQGYNSVKQFVIDNFELVVSELSKRGLI